MTAFLRAGGVPLVAVAEGGTFGLASAAGLAGDPPGADGAAGTGAVTGLGGTVGKRSARMSAVRVALELIRLGLSLINLSYHQHFLQPAQADRRFHSNVEKQLASRRNAGDPPYRQALRERSDRPRW